MKPIYGVILILIGTIILGLASFTYMPRTKNIIIEDGKLQGSFVVYDNTLYPANCRADFQYLDSIKKSKQIDTITRVYKRTQFDKIIDDLPRVNWIASPNDNTLQNLNLYPQTKSKTINVRRYDNNSSYRIVVY